MEPRKDKFYLMLSFLAALVSFLIYNYTKAPTASFWDCGEFIASSYIMGVPHPPGYPMFIIIGRLFTMLPIAAKIAVRVNMISVLGSAASVFVAFWLIVYIFNMKRSDSDNSFSRIGVGIGAFCGSIIMGFSYTFWSSAVEAEVYALAMLLMLLINLFAVVWVRNFDEPGNDRWLILISFLLWFSLGIHMTTFIILIPVLGYLAYYDFKKNGFSRWPVWAAMGLFILYAVPLQVSILHLIGLNISSFELESFLVIFAIALLAAAVMLLSTSRDKPGLRGVWMTTFLIMVIAAIGLSSQLYIPIRAAEKPAINENNPSDWNRFKWFLERKQYQQESMVDRMFRRRGSWGHQLVSDPRFGLLYYLERQFSSPASKITLVKGAGQSDEGGFNLKLSMLYILILGLWGIYETIKRAPPEGMMLLITTLLCTVGLVVYMNFSDGSYNTMIAPLREVRDRDYFYTPGFMYFAIIIGLGMTFALHRLGNLIKAAGEKQGLFKAVFVIAAAACVALAANTVFANYDHNTRRGNYLPAEYARNILDSCAQNGILFTNGDNDTFPLWYIQEVEHFRQDVRVVNLSLLNAIWYIHQLKDQMNVPMDLTDEEIDQLRPVRLTSYNRVLRIQDLMIQHIVTKIQKDGWKPPVYFAITVPDDNRMGLDNNLIMEGMVYRVVESRGTDRIDTSVGLRILGNPDNFRGVADPSVRKDDNERKLISNYMVAMFQLANALSEEGKQDEAIRMAKFGINIQGENPIWQSKAYLALIYARTGEIDSIVQLARGDENGERILLAAAQNMVGSKDTVNAMSLLEKTLNQYPSSIAAFNNLAILFYQEGDSAGIDSLLSAFKNNNSGNDKLITSADQSVERIRKTPAPSGGHR